MIRKHAAAWSLSAVTALALAACGGGDAPTQTGGSLTKADFIERGDAVCQELEDAAAGLEAPVDEADFARFAGELAALGRTAQEDFAALDPPADGEAVQQALVDAASDGVEALEGAEQAASSGDTVTAGDLLAEAETRGGAAYVDARSYGFTVCGAEDVEDGAGEGLVDEGALEGELLEEDVEETIEGELLEEDFDVEALSKSEFIAAGDDVCGSAEAFIDSLDQPVDEADLPRYLREVIDVVNGKFDGLAVLAAPADGVAVQEALLAATGARRDTLQGALQAAESGDSVTAGDLAAQSDAEGGAASDEAAAYGFDDCAATS